MVYIARGHRTTLQYDGIGGTKVESLANGVGGLSVREFCRRSALSEASLLDVTDLRPREHDTSVRHPR